MAYIDERHITWSSTLPCICTTIGQILVAISGIGTGLVAINRSEAQVRRCVDLNAPVIELRSSHTLLPYMTYSIT